MGILWKRNREPAAKDTFEASHPPEAGDLLEAEAIQLARGGDPAGFERIYGLHCRKVHNLCLRMTLNAAEAEDLTQEAFLQVFRKIHTFRGESAFSTWLHRVAVNIVLMHLRRKPKPETSLEEINGADENAGALIEHIAGRDLRLAGVIDRVNLQRVMEQLPPGYKAMFVLHDILGWEHQEIAKILGCSTGNSKSQLNKARRRLRGLLGESKPTRQRLPGRGYLAPVPT